MRNLLLGLTLTLFIIGCGSSNSNTKKDPVPSNQPVKASDRPATPSIQEAEKTPPSIPNI